MHDKEYMHYLEQFVTEKRRSLFKKVLEDRTRHFTVAIEDIYQPQNAAAVVRSCEVFGIQDVHVIENKYNFYASNQVAKGAQKWLSFHNFSDRETPNTSNCIDSLREKGYQIVATTPHNDASMLPDFDVTKKTAFFFGVEKEGLSDEVLEKADGSLKIPMVGFTESLNISVAAAIILHDVTSRVKASGVPWQLSDEEKAELYLEWLEKSIKSIKRIKEHYFKKLGSVE